MTQEDLEGLKAGDRVQWNGGYESPTVITVRSRVFVVEEFAAIANAEAICNVTAGRHREFSYVMPPDSIDYVDRLYYMDTIGG